MNYLDFGILAVIGISSLIGMYYGFTVSFLTIASYVCSWLGSLILYPSLSKFITNRYPDFIDKLIYYTDGASSISMDERVMSAASLSQENISEIVNVSGLPFPFDKLLQSNLVKHSMQGLESIGQYFDHTIANIITNLISFLIVFFIIRIIFFIAISIARNITNLPVLKQFDSLMGAGLGAVRGVLFLFILFALVPIVLALAPIDIISQYIEESVFASFFMKTNIFTSFLRGII